MRHLRGWLERQLLQHQLAFQSSHSGQSVLRDTALEETESGARPEGGSLGHMELVKGKFCPPLLLLLG